MTPYVTAIGGLARDQHDRTAKTTNDRSRALEEDNRINTLFSRIWFVLISLPPTICLLVRRLTEYCCPRARLVTSQLRLQHSLKKGKDSSFTMNPGSPPTSDSRSV